MLALTQGDRTSGFRLQPFLDFWVWSCCLWARTPPVLVLSYVNTRGRACYIKGIISSTPPPFLWTWGNHSFLSLVYLPGRCVPDLWASDLVRTWPVAACLISTLDRRISVHCLPIADLGQRNQFRSGSFDSILDSQVYCIAESLFPVHDVG